MFNDSLSIVNEQSFSVGISKHSHQEQSTVLNSGGNRSVFNDRQRNSLNRISLNSDKVIPRNDSQLMNQEQAVQLPSLHGDTMNRF